MNLLTQRFALTFALAFALASRAQPALAEGVPAHFVSAGDCTSRPCTCDDIPMMQEFLQNQKDAKDAWAMVQSELFTPAGPQSLADAVASFQSKFGGNANVSAQFKSCDGYDPSVNSLGKVAGVSGLGSAMLDPCFCNAFCQDIVDSTVTHERWHVPSNIMGVFATKELRVGCKLGVLPEALCNGLDPLALVQSELTAHQKGIDALQSDLNDLIDKDPAMPEMACTWQPLSGTQSAAVTTERAPAGFFARVSLLLERILWGEPPTQVASLDGAR